MSERERKQFLQEFDETQKQIRAMQKRLNKNPSLLKDATFQDQRTRLFYKSYCIDCTLHGEWAVSYKVYLAG